MLAHLHESLSQAFKCNCKSLDCQFATLFTLHHLPKSFRLY